MAVKNQFLGLFGEESEWFELLGSIKDSISGFAGSIFYYSDKHQSRQFAWINALMFLSCGRILFWDSMLGYIDIFYSWICFLQFMVIFQLSKKFQNYRDRYRGLPRYTKVCTDNFTKPCQEGLKNYF